MAFTIEEIRGKAVPVAKAYGVKSVGLFSSYARGEANQKSDVDLYIDRGRLRSLIQYFSFIGELEKSLGCHVDVVTTGIKDQDFIETIRKEGVLLYEE